jgi:hypothetical protein
MKKVLFGLSILATSILANAQETTFKPFKFDIATGYAVPGGSGTKGGLIFAFEPKYALNDNITVGLRWEGAVMVRATVDANGETMKGDAKASGFVPAYQRLLFQHQQLQAVCRHRRRTVPECGRKPGFG